jgi:esterase/lipase
MRKLQLVLITLPVLVVVLAGLLLSQGKTLGERHQAFQGTAFNYNAGTFLDYINWSRERVVAARLDEPSSDILNNLLPFELHAPEECPRSDNDKAEQGIVLTHGLFETAFSMRELGSFLQSQCFHVLGVLLPAHGSRPGDFLETSWQDWLQTVRFAAQQLADKAERVMLAGHSAGGALSILEAVENTDVDALILFAPALDITDAAKYAQFVTPLGKLFPRAAWVSVEPDDAIYRYESITFTAASEMHAMIKNLHERDQTRLRSLPIFTVASMEDTTVSTPRILDFMNANTHEHSRTLLYSQHTAQSSERIRVIPSEDRMQGVLSTSHLGLMNSPDNHYYGKDGEYRNCGHYGSSDNADFILCKNGQRAWYGEATRENREEGIVERIAFNPYYDAMLGELLAFVKRL